jgi:PAS domain S-box-containing protein
MSGQILIVDDHELVRSSIRSVLSSRPDWKICGEAADGIEAIEKARSLRPDIILMDISMPRMNGLEATRAIHKELPGSSVVLVTQNDPAIARRQAKEVNAAAFVAKSNLVADLLPTLERLTPDSAVASTQDAAPPPTTTPEWLAGGGELGRLIGSRDWSQTSLGPIDAWPQSLKTSVNLILNARHPMWISWGKDAAFLYNDAYIQVLSLAKHPGALGKPTTEVWPEIWDIIGPLIDKVYQKGEASFQDDVRFLMNRGDFIEETYYSFSYSPIRDESGAVAGLFCPTTEVTPKVINARRLRTLSELSSNALLQRTIEAACASVAATLTKNPEDVPFAVLYLIDSASNQARLEQTCGISTGVCSLTPHSIDLSAENSTCLWPLAQVARSAQSQVVSLDNIEGLPLGLAQQRLSQAVVLPVTSRGEGGLFGVLVAGVNAARKLDVEYRTFYELTAGQIATAIQNARAAEEERKRIEALAEIDRAKTAFFSNVSHEFRTPLTLMLGPVEELLARSHTDLSPAAKRQLELVSRNGTRLLRLVNTLLDFSRLEAGRMQAIYLPTDLAAFTIDLASVFRSATERAGLGLELDCPKLAEPVFVDRGMWEKIVLNLVSNAFKFTFDGKISISLKRAGGDVELRVRDTGVGIPEHELPRLFDRFHRIENAKSRTHEGSGIGLALVLELVKLHGGKVRVESVYGQGSTFIVSVPFGTAHLPADRMNGSRSLASTAIGAAPFVEEALRWLPETEQRDLDEEVLPDHELMPLPYAPAVQDEAGSANRPHILVADDNADMRQYLTRLLSERYRVEAVPDGQAALDAVRARPPNLVLTDVMMPHLDGFGLLRELRSAPGTRTLPIILLSARAGEESRVEGMEQGADDYLIKPFSARELLARVQTHLEMARIREESEVALRQRTAQFETLLNEAPLGVYLVDADFKLRAMNPTALQMFSDVADFLGLDFGQWIRNRWPQPVADEILGRFRHTLEAGIPHIEPEWNKHRLNDEVQKVTEWQIHRIPLPEGRHGVVCYFRDISAQVQARERERELTAEAIAATAKFRAVFEQTPVFAGIMSSDGLVLDANQLCLQACGYLEEDVLGRYFWECGWWRLSTEAQAKIKAATANAARGIPYQEILNYHWADGTERVVDFGLHPILDDQGKILFLHPTGVDITELKRAEEKYRTLAETLDAEVRVRTNELEKRNIEVIQQSEQLRDLSGRLMQAQDEERRRIARELHDSAGQLLTALGINLARIAQRAAENASPVSKEANDSQQLVQQLSQEVRTMSYLLHPPLLDEVGLSEALGWYTEGLMERSGLDIRLEIPEDFGRLPREMELVLFRLVQECLTNIHRHSDSKNAAITLFRNGKIVSIQIRDEGKGISPEKLAKIQSQGSGVGIRGMRERIRQFEGVMHIQSNGTGTTISFVFPMPEERPSTPEGVSQTIPANQ